MDPASLAASIVGTFLAPFVTNGARELGGDVARQLWERVRSLFSEPDERSALELFEKRPDVHGTAIEKLLCERIEADPGLRAELEALVRPAQPGASAGVRIMRARDVGVIDNRDAQISGGTFIGQVNRRPDEPSGSS